MAVANVDGSASTSLGRHTAAAVRLSFAGLAFAATLVAFYLTQGLGLTRRMRRLAAAGAATIGG